MRWNVPVTVAHLLSRLVAISSWDDSSDRRNHFFHFFQKVHFWYFWDFSEKIIFKNIFKNNFICKKYFFKNALKFIFVGKLVAISSWQGIIRRFKENWIYFSISAFKFYFWKYFQKVFKRRRSGDWIAQEKSDRNWFQNGILRNRRKRKHA